MCADTTNANLGLRGGAAAIFEQILNRDILYLPCRHHIYELVLSAAFTAKIPGTSGPNNQIFLKFRNEWDIIQSLNPVIENALEYINSSLKPRIPNMVKFIKQYLEKQQLRDDYKELLELSLMFLGEEKDAFFYKPGACHHARWMAKAIYSLKMV